ncbi:helix-turn-helix domain-containing protein [Halalkalicoccus tibetensis]|uniref:Helix-turn-helix domain-containing protein n=1 Tax=Halalkalicoccus tibetensis TaxID=175632 RepID=A0ABD5VAB9_9EURY
MVHEECPTQTLQSVEITFNIIETFQEQNPFAVTELDDRLGHPKSTIHSHL